MTSNELRKKYLEFFKSKGHTIVPSASLVPENNPTVLFTMAGMFPLVPYLMGQEHPAGARIANAQKCIRTIDIEEVGDDTHLTFFEMLGNWSLGDYFKKDAIEWSFEFLTSKEWLGLPIERLAFSVFAGDNDAPRDEESASIWLSLGVPRNRIAYLPKEDNWWIAGNTGPCGPDTEMFYWVDDGSPAPANFQDTKDDKRWVEIWNDVFMQYEKKPDGSLVPLAKQNVDTGMGLDRVVPILNGQKSVYDVDVFKDMFDVVGLSQDIMSNDEIRKARVVADHVRASVFIVNDGVEPSNKERGYVLRRLLRRSIVFAKLLNLKSHWLEALMGKVVFHYAEPYPELLENQNRIFYTILDEQKKFGTTLEKGLKVFENAIARKPKEDGTFWDMSKEIADRLETVGAFDLYQTYGFPLEVVLELIGQYELPVDKNRLTDNFNKKFEEHKELSRTATAGVFKGGLANTTEKTTQMHTTTHLLQSALRKVLGNNVWQKGSNVNEERTRFDFTYGEKLTDGQKKQVEDLVNQWIKVDYEVKREFVPLEVARERNAIGLFGEKYADTVSIYTVYDSRSGEVVSCEFCGGPHVDRTGKIAGKFRIAKEEAVSAGVRRIKGVIE